MMATFLKLLLVASLLGSVVVRGQYSAVNNNNDGTDVNDSDGIDDTLLILRRCQSQEYYLLNPNEPGAAGALQELYTADFFEYGQDPLAFIQARAAICGGGNSSFVALGRVIVGDYQGASELLFAQEQVRGWFVGRGELNPDRVPTPYFTPALSDANTDTPEGRSGVHGILRQNLIDTFMIPAQNRVKSDEETRDALQQYTDELIQNLQSLEGGPHSNIEATTDFIRTFASRWVMKAMFEIELNDDTLALMRSLFMEGRFLAFSMEPLASQISFEDGLKLSEAIESAVALVESTPAVRNYAPTASSFNLSKEEYTKFVTTVLLGVSPMLAVLIRNFFTEIPIDQLDALNPDNHLEIGRAVLESTRLNPAAKHVNTILSEDTILNVNGSPKLFPAGTPVAASILLASRDSEKFPNPHEFEIRDNHEEDLITFATPGNNTSTDLFPGRSCMGKHLAIKAGTDVLTALVRYHQTKSPSETSHNMTHSSKNVESEFQPQDCLAKFSALNFRFDNFHLYERYFRDDSTFILPAAGRYVGAQNIQEYVRFASTSSPFIEGLDVMAGELHLKAVNNNAGTCTFIVNNAVSSSVA
ncbi:MAG: hypothetical protein SGILL_004874 [Bacillariaceae sp.]